MKILKQLTFKTILLLLSVFVFTSCEDPIEEEQGQVQFSLSQINQKNKRSKIEDATALIISVEDDLGNSIYDSKQIDLIDFSGSFLSEPLPLLVGNYKLTEFMVINSSSDVIFATPLSGSATAYLVNAPLPIDITITKDIVEKISPEILSTEGYSPEDLGYATFDLNEVITFNFQLAVMVYNTGTENLELTDYHLNIEDNGGSVFDADMEAITNNVVLRDGYDSYDVTITKDGYSDLNISYTQEQLENYTGLNPLVVILDATGNRIMLTLQPGAEDGKDALIAKGGGGRWSSSQNYGDTQEFISATWTWSGNIGYERCLIDFDISQIPATATINSAKLSMYYQSEPTGTTGHSINNNKSFMQKVTSDWDEHTVTWDNQPSVTTDNQIVFEPSQTEDQDYLDMDITSQIADKHNDPSSHYGFLFRLETEQTYRSMYFSSSDHPLENLRPKLVIEYTVN